MSYLEGKLAADVVVRFHQRHSVAGQRDTAEDRLFSAVWKGRGMSVTFDTRTRTHAHKRTQRPSLTHNDTHVHMAMCG